MTLPGGAPADIRGQADPAPGRRSRNPQANDGRAPSDDPEEREPRSGHAPDCYQDGQAVPDFSRWPLQSHLILGALPSAVPCARLHTRHILWEWGLQPLTDQAGLIVSELITNAAQASETLTASRYAGRWAPGRPPVRLWLHGQEQRIAIQVWDANNQLPVRQSADPDAESGRGLLLVESLGNAWGCYRPQRSSGKIVWATVR
jgi:anti-sigma regulatory factor (Ser/Thr protein kinase)